MRRRSRERLIARKARPMAETTGIEWTDATVNAIKAYATDKDRRRENSGIEGRHFRRRIRSAFRIRSEMVHRLPGVACERRVRSGQVSLGWSRGDMPGRAPGQGERTLPTEAASGERTFIRSRARRRFLSSAATDQLLCGSGANSASEYACLRRLRARMVGGGASS